MVLVPITGSAERLAVQKRLDMFTAGNPFDAIGRGQQRRSIRVAVVHRRNTEVAAMSVMRRSDDVLRRDSTESKSLEFGLFTVLAVNGYRLRRV